MRVRDVNIEGRTVRMATSPSSTMIVVSVAAQTERQVKRRTVSYVSGCAVRENTTLVKIGEGVRLAGERGRDGMEEGLVVYELDVHEVEDLCVIRMRRRWKAVNIWSIHYTKVRKLVRFSRSQDQRLLPCW